MVLLSLLVGGCATAAAPQPPTVELSSKALAPVGGTIPVFIERRCTANCGAMSYPLTRGQVAALSQSGKYVQAIPVDDAIKLAGGSQKLLDATGARESSASTIARESMFEMQNNANSMFAIFAVPFALMGAGSLASQPPEKIERIRLNQVSIPDCPGSLDPAHRCSVGANAAQLHHDPAIGGDRGWVFFPAGKYTRVRASYDWFPSLFSGEKERTEVIVTPWNGSSSSLVTPSEASHPPGEGPG